MTENTQTKKEEVALNTPRNESGENLPLRRGGDSRKSSQAGKRRNTRRPNKRREREKPDYDQKIVNIRRVTRVMAGGRRFSFSVAIVIGDKRGRVGVGVGKAGDTSLAIQKAINDAKKNMIQLDLTDTFSIPHEVNGKFNSAQVTMRPNGGRGIVAGSGVRTILELGGVKDVTAKVHSRSKNQLNISQATISALEPFVKARGLKAQKKFTKGVAHQEDKKGGRKDGGRRFEGNQRDAMNPNASRKN